MQQGAQVKLECQSWNPVQRPATMAPIHPVENVGISKSADASYSLPAQMGPQAWVRHKQHVMK